MNPALLPSAYLPPIQYFHVLRQHSEASIDIQEHFKKQTYRSRCHIYGANGLLKLTVPIQHAGEHIAMKDVKISYESDWQRLHWRSLEAAYRCSPFFEFYEDELAPFYLEKKIEYLIDLNNELLDLLKKFLKIKTPTPFADKYEKQPADKTDYRDVISPKTNSSFSTNQYMQVFESKHGFIPNLSVVDLLFNEGPEGKNKF